MFCGCLLMLGVDVVMVLCLVFRLVCVVCWCVFNSVEYGVLVC